MDIYSPLDGQAVDLKEVPDKTFADKIMGEGVAVKPEIIDGISEIAAPLDGEVSHIFETYHAFVITDENNISILVHIGLDTVKLNGENFTSFVKLGDKVKKGDKIISANFTKIAQAGYKTITPVILLEPEKYANIKTFLGDVQIAKTTIFSIQK
ncbi:MAG: PTS glucose transporter subunit IIA [Bifidobacteriaceae bacterium]|nr:PTS glucose transporter subunit IIA [Bifidobacteriaceae bacterium]